MSKSEEQERLVVSDVIDLDRSRALAGLLGHDPAALHPGDRLPSMWQLAYFLARPSQGELGDDGHPKCGYPSPPSAGMRRMFAGGRLSLTPGLTIGDEAVASTCVARQTEKMGRAGSVTFTTTRTDVYREGRKVLQEERDIAYLPPSDLSQPRSPARPVPTVPTMSPQRPDQAEVLTRPFLIDPIVLFRFSALTYNAHRIHYDRDYARDVEGYTGLVVHGPLQAILMADEARRHLDAEMSEFEYRLTSPLLEHEGLLVSAERQDGRVVVSVTDMSGRVTATGRAS